MTVSHKFGKINLVTILKPLLPLGFRVILIFQFKGIKIGKINHEKIWNFEIKYFSISKFHSIYPLHWKASHW